MSAYFDSAGITLLLGDAGTPETVASVPDGCVQSIITSPPYFGLRDYGEADQLGAEPSVDEYVNRLVEVFSGLRRVLADNGTVWLNLGDTYTAAPGGRRGGNSAFRNRAVSEAQTAVSATGSRRPGVALPRKSLIGVPWRVAIALQDDGWTLRSDIIWHKPNAMPESVKDRPGQAHEHLFLLAKSPKYYYDAEAIAEPLSAATVQDMARRKSMTNKGAHGGVRSDLARARTDYVRADGLRSARNVWTINTTAFRGAHFAVWPPELVRRCVLASSAPGDTILDPFQGSGTTGMVALDHGRRYIGIDLNRDYLDLSLRTRFQQSTIDLTGQVAP